ncbi:MULTISPECIES: acetyl-CoA carboxylase biotin carboxyl carrier protein [unclassified Pseudomonas]|uniref:acetyl-CoA carboxylase biotin carboxyl carrier protein n=1 Tax=unclassified Pseudomonas TaxID=196821 RepID=UPI000A099C7F|nr:MULTISPECIES: acetyl-CoA carboxylase biotin carboxyl carrier protein [unclassified Pseudomonas]SMF54613.1 biotin carboxyl carrier protein [Pseudomonas sp. LAIL14HWK12:I11]SMR79651.1 biotin carboxyl carrier protein [Pseudomonas sp. LAIL14HWK12:I10]SOD07053.1 biotin carboxyl carrier protein [Pseudomonas sp. LAIL14HWK12:I8]
MDIRKVKKLIELLEESGIDELEIKEGEESVRISRHSKTPAAQQFYAPAPMAAAPVAAPAAAAAPVAEAAAPALKGTVVRSPMVGTFYRKPSPTSPNFAEVGQSVKKGDTLCIVEAMKMMNHIEAEIGGVIDAILVEDGQPVEFDQPLFTIV